MYLLHANPLFYQHVSVGVSFGEQAHPERSADASAPLFARFFLNGMFRFGFHYRIFGYEVWLGEALLPVSAYPPEYENWLEYIRDMGNLEGIKAVPAFYAADHYTTLGATMIYGLVSYAVSVLLRCMNGPTRRCMRIKTS